MSTYDTDQKENSKRFFRLADKLDVLLRHFVNNIYILNNTNIHLPRNHPEYLHIWKPVIYKKSPKINDLIKITLFLFKSISINTVSLIPKFFEKNNRNLNTIIDKSIDYIFISHHLGNNNDSDFYYGDLINDLATAEKSILRLLIPQTAWVILKPEEASYLTILLNKNVSKFMLLKYIINNSLAISKLLFYCRKNRFTYYEIICILIGQIENFNNYKLTLNIEALLLQANIKNLVMTFEGNAIERSIFYLCHRHKIKSFGYQHAPIIKDQNSIFRLLSPELNPDVILASGPYTFLKFKKKLGPSCTIRLIGSPKFVERKDTTVDVLQKKNGQILLVPDGNTDSVIKFCKMGHALSSRDSRLSLKIRAHPLFIDLLNEQMILDTKDDNFSVSLDALNEDLEKSSWVIYENSSVAIQAIFYNCNLIYFENLLANVDPLFDLHHNKYTAVNLDEVYNLVQKHVKPSDFDVNLAYSFGKNYFHPTDHKIYLTFDE
jgi:hypothetical protein